MITDKFGITKEEYEAVKSEAERLETMGYNVPNITIKHIAHANGVAGQDTIYLNPNTNLDELTFCLRHEIGHHNEPETEFDIWAEPKTWEQIRDESETFANDFARRTTQ